jgi:5'-phosphate synthase pdxT subunit
VVGILALQGDVRAHTAAFAALGTPTREVRTPNALAEVDALVLPGGESTTLLHLLGDLDAWSREMRRLVARGGGLFATCAGLIVLARAVHPAQPSLALLDVEVERNGWGRQIDSFELGVPAPGDPHGPLGEPLEAVFIRAPRILATGPEVEVLATISAQPGAEPVLVRQGSILAATFHPELTPDRRVQRLFLAALDTSPTEKTLGSG